MKRILAATAATALAFGVLGAAAPAVAKVQVSTGGDREVVIGKSNKDLLEELIALDAKGIADMQSDFVDARREIDASIAEVAAAREEAHRVPFARFIVRMAFSSAAEATTEASREGFDEARVELSRAELKLRSAAVSAAERQETQGAIDMIRGELSLLQASLERLAEALRNGTR